VVKTAAGLEHDAEKWVPVFGKTSCSNNNLKRDGDAKKDIPLQAYLLMLPSAKR
jgi:hypothetical protein